jgi:hypothetical protein
MVEKFQNQPKQKSAKTKEKLKRQKQNFSSFFD